MLLQEMVMKLNFQQQLNEELRICCKEQEERHKDILMENIHMQGMRLKYAMDDEENRRTASLLAKAELALTLLKRQYDEDMQEVQILAKVLQQRIFGLQDELAEAKRLYQQQENSENRVMK
jgi:hypothetical protein